MIDLQPLIDPNLAFSLLEGRTAEWIIERPTRVGGEDLYVLPDYQVFRFRGCTATVHTGSGDTDQDMTGASLIRMADWDHDAEPGLIVSTADYLGPHSLLMRYGDLDP